MGKGSFQLEDDIPVILAPGAERELDVASDLSDYVRERAGVFWPIERMGKLDGIGKRVLLLVAGRDDALDPRLKKLAAPLDKIAAPLRDQAYVLKISTREIVAVAQAPQGLHNAAQTLKQLVSGATAAALPALRIVDWPTYAHRGVMLDISRFKVPKMETLLELVDKLAALKINTFQLYTEHTFSFRRHPDIGKNCGSMAPEDILWLDAFCQSRFVELNANFQSFGHQKHMLSLPQYNALAETPEKPWTLCPLDKRTYALLDDLYAECLPAYRSKLFNASCDETWDLGQGRSRAEAEKKGVGRVYLEHIVHIEKLARKYGKRLMIWGDIVLGHPELIPEIPKDILMLDWSYFAGQDLSGMGKIRHAGLELWTCPGVTTWTRIFSDMENACQNIAERAVTGAKENATGLLNTDWGDNGHAQTPSGSYHGYAWGAEQSWSPSLSTEAKEFDRRFARAWFDDDSGRFGELYRTLGQAEKRASRPGGMHCFGLYWAPFPCPPDGKLAQATPANIKRVRGVVKKSREILRVLKRTAREHRPVLDELQFVTDQLAFAMDKAEISLELAQQSSPPTAAQKRRVRTLLKTWQAQRTRFKDLWLARNRRSEIAYRLRLYTQGAADYRKWLG